MVRKIFPAIRQEEGFLELEAEPWAGKMGEHACTVVIRICSWRFGVLPEEGLEVQEGSRRCRGEPELQNSGLRGPGESRRGG